MQELEDIYKGVLLVKSTFKFIHDIGTSVYSSVNLISCGIANGMIKSGVLKNNSIDQSILIEEEGILEKKLEAGFPSRMQKLKDNYANLVKTKEEELQAYFNESSTLDVKQSILKFDMFDRNLQEQLLIKHATDSEKSPSSLLYNVELLKVYIKATTGFCMARLYELSESIGFLIGNICYAIQKYSPEAFKEVISKVLDPVAIGKIYLAVNYFVDSFVSECLSVFKSTTAEFISSSIAGFTDGMLEANQEYIKDHLETQEKLKRIQSDLETATYKVENIDYKKSF